MDNTNDSTPKKIAKAIGKGLLTGVEFAFEILMSTAQNASPELNRKLNDLDQEYDKLSHDFSYYKSDNVAESKRKKESRLNEIAAEQNKIMKFQENYQRLVDGEDDFRDQIKKMKGR